MHLRALRLQLVGLTLNAKDGGAMIMSYTLSSLRSAADDIIGNISDVSRSSCPYH